ncbi:MAG: hypothetical protein KF893_05610 [Caldilineaceae bacterium]|nr:hypothetical protein [Caldilineaceae bacterium]
MADLPVNVLRYGREEALPEIRTLHAGPISLRYTADGDLRNIRVGNQEILNRLYVAVRDHNWNTIPVELSKVEIEDEGDSFRICYNADHREGPIDFHWQGTITGGRDGAIRFEMDGEARSTFLRNRIGFCVLHPAALAGAPCTVEHVDGATADSHFPRRISPDQPFFDLRAITHHVTPSVRAEVRMEGDTFEMEDQRNWTDASYKTYCTPLGLPFPVEIAAGTKVHQAVTLKLHGEAPQSSAMQRERLTFQIHRRQVGEIPHLGLSLSTQESALNRKEVDRLRALHLSHLRVDLDFARPDWDEMLRRATDEADAIGCRLEIAVHLSQQMEDELKQLRAMIAQLRPPISHWLIYHKDEKGVNPECVTLARQHLTDYDRIKFGAGTNAYFTELNRFRPPAETLDLVCYSVNPQVHAFDNLSLMETLPIQATTVESARLLAAGRPIVVSPITLRPRFNPNATGAEEEAADQLPSQVDPRQMSLFGAAWTVGSLAALAQSSVDRVTYYETVGWRGVMETETGSPLPDQFRSIPGGVYPLYHVLADVAGCAGAPVLLGEASDSEKISGLVFEREGALRVLVANLTSEPQDVTIHHGGDGVRVQMLNEHSIISAMRAPEAFRSEERPPIRPAHGQTAVRLLPYAVVRLDVEKK